MGIEEVIRKLKSADSHHTQKEYALNDEAIDMAIVSLEKIQQKELVEVVHCNECKYKGHCDIYSVLIAYDDIENLFCSEGETSK